jgi:hypothetical protein
VAGIPRALRLALAGGMVAMACAALGGLPGPGARTLVPGPFAAGQILAASADPSPASGDTRSPGEGPGFVGAPLVAILAVLGLGLATALLTIVYVRLTGGPSGGSGPPER